MKSFSSFVGSVITVALIGSVLTTSATTVTYKAESSTFVHNGEKTKLHNGLIADNVREGLMRLDVSGMENCTNAVLRLYTVQHHNDDTKPILLRQTIDGDWRESQATLTNLTHEFSVFPSPWISTNHPQCIGYCPKVPALNEWMEIDITEAVKREAVRTGKLSFIISALGWRGSYNTPTCFAAMSYTNTALRPQLRVTWPENESRGTSYNWIQCPATDDVTYEKAGASIRLGDIFLVNQDAREAFLKFDLFSTLGKGKVRRAIIKFPQRTFANEAAKGGYLKPFENTAWTESECQPNVLPHGLAFKAGTTNDAIPVGYTWNKEAVNDVDITPFLRDAVHAGKDKLSLHLFCKGTGYIMANSHRMGEDYSPTIWVDMYQGPTVTEMGRGAVTVSWDAVPDATTYTVERAGDIEGPYHQIGQATTACALIDPTVQRLSTYWYRVRSQTATGESVSPATRHQQIGKMQSRPIVHYTRVNSWVDKDSSSHSENETQTECQLGSSDDFTTGGARALHFFMMFDPAGLEEASFVRLRVKVTQTANANGERRAFATLTDKWECSKLTWNNMLYQFDSVSKNTDSLYSTVTYPLEINRINHFLGNSSAAKTFGGNVLEFDVTELAREAAQKGKYLTIMLATTRNHGWNWIASPTAAGAPELVYPEQTGFANVISASANTTGEYPTVQLAWTPSALANSYAIDRYDTKKQIWDMTGVPCAEASYLDTLVASGRDYIYKITANLPENNQYTVIFTNQLNLAVAVTSVFDGYARNTASTTPLTTIDRAIVMKDGGGSTFNGGTREGFIRFSLHDIPAGTTRVMLDLHNSGGGGENVGDDEFLYIRTIPDADWTEEVPPIWSDIYGAIEGPTDPHADGIFYVRDLRKDASPLVPDGAVQVDVTQQIEAAKAAGQSHILFHVFIRDADASLNFHFYSKESPYSDTAPQLLCIQNWDPFGTLLLLR